MSIQSNSERDRSDQSLRRPMEDLGSFLQSRQPLFLLLMWAALCAYGFELFNFNITLDEEMAAKWPIGFLLPAWVSQGRWGMGVLARVLMPYPIVPFVPLFLALTFTIIGAILLLDAWSVKNSVERAVFGSLFVTFPVLAYMYCFSTLNFGIGLGFLLVGACLACFSYFHGWARLWAVGYGALAVSLYQGLLLCLVCAFLLLFVRRILMRKAARLGDYICAGVVLTLSVVAYEAIQQLFVYVLSIPASAVPVELSLDLFLRTYKIVLPLALTTIEQMYAGTSYIYGYGVNSLGLLMAISLLSLLVALAKRTQSKLHSLIAACMLVAAMTLPFVFILLMGNRPVGERWLMTMPLAVAGVVMLGLTVAGRRTRIITTVVAAFTVVQFCVSTNHILAAGHLALQADRSLATRVIDRIEVAEAKSPGVRVDSLEVVGIPRVRPMTNLIPRSDELGGSFFYWNSYRATSFMETMGLPARPAPTPQQGAHLVARVLAMPAFPLDGSVELVDHTLIVKLGNYTAGQVAALCGEPQNKKVLPEGFCN